MLLWSILNWRILELDEIQALYERRAQETGFSASRPMEDCLCRLVQRGLVADGSGETASDSLYNLLSELYIVPISDSLMLRFLSFVRLTIFRQIPFAVTKKYLVKDKRSEDEKQVMHLANQAILSTAELIKCFQRKKLDFCCEEELLDELYGDDVTTSDNMAFMVQYLPECRPVILSVANLYLRRQIIFERI